jgi:predicted nucleic acid-binding protein
MILVDTSVWIAHFRKGGPRLGELLSEALVLVHPFVVGELACGNLKNRARILSDLGALPSAVSATHEEVMRLIEDRKLWGLGIGWIDTHLLASALLSNCQFWTLDGRLVRAAAAAGVKLYRRA